MFTANLKRSEDRVIRQTFVMYVDTLIEAEIFLQNQLSYQYDYSRIRLVHEHDLIYDVYADDEKVCTLEIHIGDI